MALSATERRVFGPGAWGVCIDVKAPTERRPLLDVAGAADYLTTSEHFVRRLVRERRVTYVKVGRFVRFDPDDLDRFIEAGRQEVSA